MTFFPTDEQFDPWRCSSFGLTDFRMSFMIFPEIQSCNFAFGLINFRMVSGSSRKSDSVIAVFALIAVIAVISHVFMLLFYFYPCISLFFCYISMVPIIGIGIIGTMDFSFFNRFMQGSGRKEIIDPQDNSLPVRPCVQAGNWFLSPAFRRTPENLRGNLIFLLEAPEETRIRAEVA